MPAEAPGRSDGLAVARDAFDPAACPDCACLRPASTDDSSGTLADPPAVTELLWPLPAFDAETGGLRKRAFSRTRYAFWIGLEGTGHHRWAAAWTDMHKRGSLYNLTLTPKDTAYSQATWVATSRGLHLYHEPVAETRPSLLQNLHGVQRSLVTMANRSPLDALFWLNCAGETMSYPAYRGAHRPYQYPDVLLLAQAAESVGADLRIVVMLRDPAELVESSTSRFFSSQKDADEVRVNVRLYTMMLDVIIAAMSVLDPRFFVCEDVDNPNHGTLTGVEPLLHHLHPELLTRGADALLAGMHREPHVAESGAAFQDMFPDLGPVLALLRSKTQRLRHLCHRGAAMAS